MHALSKLRAFVGAVPRASARREARNFLASTTDCRKTQRDVLMRLLRLNAESRFGDEYRLADVRSVADFRRRLPVADYEFFRPYIEELKLGNHRALLGPNNRLLMFTLSSGTTSQSKFIPITKRFLDDYRHGWQVWGINTLDDHPGINCRQIVQLSSDYDRFRTVGGTPCGNISGLVAAVQKKIVQTMYTVPGVVSKISDPVAKNYTALRLALADEHVGMVVTANPSTLIHLAKMAEAHSQRLIRDIADGTLTPPENIEAKVRTKLRRRVGQKNRARARQLSRIIESTGELRPRDYWTGLQTLAVWSAGSAGAYVRSLRRFYGDIPIRDHGLSASEGRMTIPMHDNCPAGILDVSTHFFEFIPEDEYESDHPTVLEAHQLEEGRNYYILLTTSSGLYRYNICDVVRCTGFYRTTPMLEFLHKGAHISNITGEKVSESQVVNAVGDCVERMQLHLKHFTVSPVWGDPPHYQLLIEEHDVLSPAIGRALAENVDRRLQQINCEYHEKRKTGRLARMRWLPLPDDTWMKYSGKRQQRLGGSLEQYKHPCLVPDLQFSSKLLRECAAEYQETAAPFAPTNGRPSAVQKRRATHPA